jgi:hypothetical protein
VIKALLVIVSSWSLVSDAAFAQGFEGKIQFADREELSQIVKQARAKKYPLRSIIHHIAQSKLFRNK